MGIDGQDQVYLDLTHLPKEKLHKLEAILETYQKYTGDDPRKVPMKIFPAVHYSMGGGWVDFPAADDPDREVRFRQMTNLKGCFNAESRTSSIMGRIDSGQMPFLLAFLQALWQEMKSPAISHI